MVETSGFFNAEVMSDGSYDRVYTAETFAQYFAQFIGNGVYANPATQLQVTQLTEPAMGVRVTAGNAFINGYWYKTTGKNLMLSDASGSTSRYDLIVLRLDHTTRSAYVDVVEGVSAVSPTVPSITRNSERYELALAKVHIKQATVEVSDALITDLRPDNSVCGFVTGVVDQIETTDLFAQYEAEFRNWFNQTGIDYHAWFEATDEEFDAWLATTDEGFKQWFNNLKASINSQTDRYSMLFNDWFSTIQGRLEGDIATKLYGQIQKLNISTIKGIYGFEAKTTTETVDGTITEQYQDGKKVVTTELSETVIEQKFYNSLGSLVYTKTITENEDGSVTETVVTEEGAEIHVNDGIYEA